MSTDLAIHILKFSSLLSSLCMACETEGVFVHAGVRACGRAGVRACGRAGVRAYGRVRACVCACVCAHVCACMCARACVCTSGVPSNFINCLHV